ncbi:MAG: Rieske 2Fe-2S domain-containing protein [Candidatus Kapaibacterium sp.]
MGEEIIQSRREFLGKTLALAAIAVLNPFEIFWDTKDVLASGGNQTLGTFSVDLTLSKYAALKNVNGSVAISIPGAKPSTSIILTRTSATQFQAVNRSCTHQGYFVDPFSTSSQRIICQAHGSEFLADGTVMQGPAFRDLPNYPTKYDAVNSPNIVTINIPSLTVQDGQVAVTGPDLYQNFPNPVKESTTIRFKLYSYSKVMLTVTDALGHIIAVLTDGELPEGEYSFDFNASIFPSGSYFYHLNADGEIQSKQMVVLR